MKLLPVPSRRSVIVLAWLAFIVVLVLLVWLAGRVLALAEAVDAAETQASERGQDVDDLSAIVDQYGKAINRANRCIRSDCGDTVTPPDTSDIPGPAGDVGPVGPIGPQGPRGEPGATGPRGPSGEPGDDGSDGDSGTNGDTGATGQQGPPGPQGEQGPAGPQGEQGPPGADATCEGEFVCQPELDAAIAQLVAIIQALGCEVSVAGNGPPLVIDCSITGKP